LKAKSEKEAVEIPEKEFKVASSRLIATPTK
jgi:hypothetical protein